MLYKPEKQRLWDSWIVPHNNRFYMYYIRVSENGTRWDGISLAISNDLIHWQEHGTVLKKHKDAIWLGTGMVMKKVDDSFIMNYSEERPQGFQRIYFAFSTDLINWVKIDDVVCEPNPKFYMTQPEETSDYMPRWDSLGIAYALNGQEGPYTAFCTASIKKDEQTQKNGVLGLVKSADGIHWNSFYPASDDFNAYTAYEVPDHVEFNGRHYVLFCDSSYLGFRYDSLAETMSGGTYYVVSDKIDGPYKNPIGDPMLIGCRDHELVTMNYVGRTFKYKDKVLLYHIWGELDADGWVGPVKELVEVKPYQLSVRYFSGNEKLKDNLFDYKIDKYLKFKEYKRLGIKPSVVWEICKSKLHFSCDGSSNAILIDKEIPIKSSSLLDLSDGIFIEYSMKVEGRGAGIIFGEKKSFTVMISPLKQRVEFGWLRDGWGGNLVLNRELYKRFDISEEYNCKLIIRRNFLELYVNEVFIHGMRLKENIDFSKIGFYAEDSDGFFSNFQVFGMK